MKKSFLERLARRLGKTTGKLVEKARERGLDKKAGDLVEKGRERLKHLVAEYEGGRDEAATTEPTQATDEKRHEGGRDEAATNRPTDEARQAEEETAAPAENSGEGDCEHPDRNDSDRGSSAAPES